MKRGSVLLAVAIAAAHVGAAIAQHEQADVSEQAPVLSGSPSPEPPSTRSRVLSVEEFVRLAAQNDTVFQEILIDQLTLQYQKDLRLPPRDIVLAVQQQYELATDGDGDIDTAVSLSKLFPEYGTQVRVDYVVEDSRRGNRRTSDVAFSIGQPIAENAFGKATRLRSRIIGLEVDVATHQIVEAYEDYFALILSAYVTWHETAESLKIGEDSYRENVRLLDEMRKREATRIALPIDVNKVKLQVHAKEEVRVDLREDHKIASNIIEKSVRLGRQTTLGSKTPDEYDRLPGPFESEYEEFKSSRRTYRILDLLERRSALQVQKDADDLLPSIELTAGYRLEGDDYSFDDDESILFAGVTIALPFTDQVEEAEYQVSRIDARKRKLINTNTDYQLYTDAKNLYQQIDRERSLLEIAKTKIELARAVLKDETQNYIYGKVTLNDYIQAVNILDDNRFNRVEREARLRRLLIEWLRLTDQLVTKKEIDERHPLEQDPSGSSAP